jgi:hypothetical protein
MNRRAFRQPFGRIRLAYRSEASYRRRLGRLSAIRSPRVQRWLGATLLILLSACSTIEILYDQADTLLSYKVDQYFDLTDHQQDFVDRRIKALMAWHRREELPDYARFIADLNARLVRGLVRGDLEWFYRGLEDRYRRIAERLSDDAASVLSTRPRRPAGRTMSGDAVIAERGMAGRVACAR